MNFDLSETQLLIRETARKFAREVVAPRARKTDREELFPTEAYRLMGELGLLGVNVPSEYGGAEAGVLSYSLAVIEMHLIVKAESGRIVLPESRLMWASISAVSAG